MKKIILILSLSVFAIATHGDTVFDTFGPGDTYYQQAGWDVGWYNPTPTLQPEAAMQFTALTSGNLATVDLGLVYFPNLGPANVYLYGDLGGTPDNANQTFLGSATPTALFGTTDSSVVSISVAGTIPVTMGTTYWLVLKPTSIYMHDSWQFSWPVITGIGYASYDDINWFFNSSALAAFRLTATAYAAQVQPPINADGSSIFNSRRGVIAVRFTLTYGGVATCTLPPATIAVTRTAGGVTGDVNESVYTASADTGSNFRISGCQYIYNLPANALGVGIYRVDIMINGQVVGSTNFELR